MDPGHLVDQRQPEAEATSGAGRGAPGEAFHQPVGLLGIQPFAVVDHVDRQPAVGRAHRHPHVPAGGSVSDRVVDQRDDRPAQGGLGAVHDPGRIAGPGGWIGGQFDRAEHVVHHIGEHLGVVYQPVQFGGAIGAHLADQVAAQQLGPEQQHAEGSA